MYFFFRTAGPAPRLHQTGPAPPRESEGGTLGVRGSRASHASPQNHATPPLRDSEVYVPARTGYYTLEPLKKALYRILGIRGPNSPSWCRPRTQNFKAMNPWSTQYSTAQLRSKSKPHPKPQTPNPKPQTPNPKPLTLNPKP